MAVNRARVTCNPAGAHRLAKRWHFAPWTASGSVRLRDWADGDPAFPHAPGRCTNYSALESSNIHHRPYCQPCIAWRIIFAFGWDVPSQSDGKNKK